MYFSVRDSTLQKGLKLKSETTTVSLTVTWARG